MLVGAFMLIAGVIVGFVAGFAIGKISQWPEGEIQEQ